MLPGGNADTQLIDSGNKRPLVLLESSAEERLTCKTYTRRWRFLSLPTVQLTEGNNSLAVLTRLLPPAKLVTTVMHKQRHRRTPRNIRVPDRPDKLDTKFLVWGNKRTSYLGSRVLYV